MVAIRADGIIGARGARRQCASRGRSILPVHCGRGSSGAHAITVRRHQVRHEPRQVPV